ncbi:hypothetical protein [Mesoterricola sediminis]|uniref:Uncharacterized protein n=1 Tax=Mesoterricola sediminis TaxID=2927980 RepID=A0AA48GV31_9BACT|nr:hypothetical protein [Mesoterricola sediminis]BDU78339.1 hypothetical protein METESE_32970 [Mesoterricola sediminis]
MAALLHPPLPSSRIPTWERRRTPDRRRWNGNRKGDPQVPRLEWSLEIRPQRLALIVGGAALAWVLLLFLAFR